MSLVEYRERERNKRGERKRKRRNINHGRQRLIVNTVLEAKSLRIVL